MFFLSTLDWFARINFLVEFSGISRLAVLMASEHLLLAPDILDDFLAFFILFFEALGGCKSEVTIGSFRVQPKKVRGTATAAARAAA